MAEGKNYGGRRQKNGNRFVVELVAWQSLANEILGS